MARTRARTLAKTASAVLVAAWVGGLATEGDSSWYQGLQKPSWQPPPQAFGLVWAPLYVLIAYASARAMDRASLEERRGVALVFGINLALNAGWSLLFFAFESPPAALVEIVGLNLSNALFVRRAWLADRTAGLLLLPYAAWTVFATVLNASIVWLNW